MHILDERSAQQCRTQIELVDSLEHRLNKERSRLQAMMQHLHMKQSPDSTTPTLGALQQDAPLTSPALTEPKTESLPEQVLLLYYLYGLSSQVKRVSQHILLAEAFGFSKILK